MSQSEIIIIKPKQTIVRNYRTWPCFFLWLHSWHCDVPVCHTLSQGVAALFGPTSPFTAHHVQSICDSKEIPHIETRWDYRAGNMREQYSINLVPYPPTISKVSDEPSLGMSSLSYINFTATIRQSSLVGPLISMDLPSERLPSCYPRPRKKILKLNFSQLPSYRI